VRHNADVARMLELDLPCHCSLRISLYQR
jgi:hypothetical protein